MTRNLWWIAAAALLCGGSTVAKAQLLTADMGPSIPRSWIVDVTSPNASVRGPLDDGLALAFDVVNSRLFRSTGPNVSRFDLDAQGNLNNGARVDLALANGRAVRTLTSLGYANGVLYGYAAPDASDPTAPTGLVSIDPLTGVTTVLLSASQLPIANGGRLAGLDADADTGILYAIVQNPAFGSAVSFELRTIDPLTGASQLLTAVPFSQRFQGTGTFDGLAAGYGRLWLTSGNPNQEIVVFNLQTGLFESQIQNPITTSNRIAGSTFVPSLAVRPPLPSRVERAVQIESVDFQAQIVRVRNTSAVTVPLDGWRFCSHDGNEDRRYTAPTGLNGRSLIPGASLSVHFLDDAPANDPLRINRSALGAFALPLSVDAYGLQLFFPDAQGAVAFGNSSLIADVIQWNRPGAPLGQAAFRTGQAVSEGLWTDVNDFIPTPFGTSQIALSTNIGLTLHGPSDYAITAPNVFTVTSLADSGPGTLRELIFVANLVPGSEIIRFDPSILPGTIALSSGSIAILDPITIEGPGARLLTIDAGFVDRALIVGPTNRVGIFQTRIEGVTFRNGNRNTTATFPSIPADAGGAILSNASSLTLIGCEFVDNQAGLGGAIYADGSVFCQDCTVARNLARNGSAILAERAVTLIGSTITDNDARFGSGSNGNTVEVNATGIDCRSSTVAINFGVGLRTRQKSAGITIVNSIVAENRTGTNAVDFISGADPGRDAFLGRNWFTGDGDPRLLSLGDNGGPTNTRLPAPGSPVLNVADPARLPNDRFDLDGDGDTSEPIPFDQRGSARIFGLSLDIGAVEVGPLDCRAVSENYGAGVAGTAGVPVLATDLPPVIGTTIQVLFGNASNALVPAVLLFGTERANLSTPFGAVLVDTPSLLFFDLPAGGLVLPLQIPSDPALCGLTLAIAQLVHADANAPSGFAFSRGLELIMGF